MILNDWSKEETHKDVKEELNKKDNDDIDALESVLTHIGEFGRYQKLLFIVMAPFGLFFAFVYFVQMFVAATPQRHWCRLPELEHLDLELRLRFTGGMQLALLPPFRADRIYTVIFRRNLTTPVIDDTWDKCVMYNANWSQVLLDHSVPPGTPLVPCKYGWEFELGDIPYHTVVSERGWVCEYAAYVPLAQTIFFVGSFIGGIFFGWMADHFGRVPALVGCNIMAFIGGIASIYTTGIWDFAFCRFLVGTSYDSCFMTLYILVLEYVGPKYRTWVANLSIALYFGSGCLMLPWIAVWMNDWRKLLWFTTLPFLIVVFVPFTVPESARWLSSRGRVNDAVKVLKRFEKVNGTKVPEDVMDDFIRSATQTRQTNETIMDLFKSGPLRKMMFFMVMVYMACALIFDGLVRMSEGLGFDFFITFTLTSATEIPSVTLLAFILDKWGRRALTCGPMTISGVFTLIAAFVPKGIPQVTLAIFARFMINMSYNAAIQWSAELLPTPVRASGTSLIHVSGYVATLVSPVIVFSERYWSSLPLLTLGVIALITITFSISLPETNGRPMPQTIEEGEKIVNSYTLCGKSEDIEDNAADVYEKEKSMIT